MTYALVPLAVMSMGKAVPAQVLRVWLPCPSTERRTLQTVSRPPEPPEPVPAAGSDWLIRSALRCGHRTVPRKGVASGSSDWRSISRALPCMLRPSVSGAEISSQATNSETGATFPGRTT